MKLTSKFALIATFGTVAASSFFAAPVMASQAATKIPDCFDVKHTTGITTQTVNVKNNCGNPVGWRVSREGADSGCFKTNPGQTDSVKWLKIDAFHGVNAC